MIEELYRFRVQWEIVCVLIVKEMDGVSIKFEAERFQE